MVVGQKIALGRVHKHQTVTVLVSDTTLAVELDGDTRVIRRTTTQAVRSIKGQRPRTAAPAVHLAWLAGDACPLEWLAPSRARAMSPPVAAKTSETSSGCQLGWARFTY